MDRIIRITLGLIIVLLAVFVTSISYTGFVEHAYRTSLSSTFQYNCTITTDAVLSNVTFFIPVPADPVGNSPIVAHYSSQEIKGHPADGDITLFDTGKATMAKITTAAIIPPEKTNASHPFTIELSISTESDGVINTRSPVEEGVMFRPVRELKNVSCPTESTWNRGDPMCFAYVIPVYADYQAPLNASVSITSSLRGRNNWKIFEPEFNEYQAGIGERLSGGNHGRADMKGTLESNKGTGIMPVFPQ